MPYTVNKVVIERAESLEDVEGALKTFSSCLIVVRDYIGQILVFLNAF
jgi:nitrate reductase NapAB chaperone NapD